MRKIFSSGMKTMQLFNDQILTKLSERFENIGIVVLGANSQNYKREGFYTLFLRGLVEYDTIIEVLNQNLDGHDDCNWHEYYMLVNALHVPKYDNKSYTNIYLIPHYKVGGEGYKTVVKESTLDGD
jgi:hypothetical protein